jgi:uncharacterized membrane protein YeiH
LNKMAALTCKLYAVWCLACNSYTLLTQPVCYSHNTVTLLTVITRVCSRHGEMKAR